jgi:DNA invertase Pin-like site-specific DNA recombinase
MNLAGRCLNRRFSCCKTRCETYVAEESNNLGFCTMAKLGYCRVSTDAQEMHLQLDALKAAGCGRIYQEKASASKKERPEFARLLDHARSGDVIIVWRLDRLARSLRQLIETMDDLRHRGIELRSLTENIVDTASPSGKLIFGIFALMGEFERDLLQQRTRAGLAAARKRGHVGGRPKRITPAALRKAKAMLASGDYSKGDVARELAVSRHTLWRELAR